MTPLPALLAIQKGGCISYATMIWNDPSDYAAAHLFTLLVVSRAPPNRYRLRRPRGLSWPKKQGKKRLGGRLSLASAEAQGQGISIYNDSGS